MSDHKKVAGKERNACMVRGYDLSDVYLGGGAIGRVFLATASKEIIAKNVKLQLLANENQILKVAIKIIYADVGALDLKKLAKYVPSEIANMNSLFGHQNIIKLLDVFISCKRVFLVMEFAAKGSFKDLFHANAAASDKNLCSMVESQARNHFRDVVRGVKAMHDKMIAHRDIKLDNILITYDDQIKLADFGFSVTVHQEEAKTETNQDVIATTLCGTPAFMAPEVLFTQMKGYDAMKADIWSLGVLLYTLVNRRYPFPGKTVKDVLANIKHWQKGSLKLKYEASDGTSVCYA